MKVDLEEVVYKPTSGEIVDQELKAQKRNNERDTSTLIFSAITVNIIMFSFGCTMAWTSPVIPMLRTDDPDLNPLGGKITTIQTSILAGVPMIALQFGTITLGSICDKIGRKKSMQYLLIFLILSNILLAFGSHIYVYYVARCLYMFISGSLAVSIPIYISEITEERNRGKYGCLAGVFVPLGNLYCFVLGPITSIRDLTLLCTLPLILCFIALMFVAVESPVYLAMKGDKEGAIQILKKLRNKDSKEIEVSYDNIELSLKTGVEEKKSSYSTLWKSKIHRKALFITLGVNLVQQLSGAPCIMTYLAPIFNDAGTQLSGNSVAILVGIVKVCCLFITAIVVERVGKRPLMLASTSLATIPIFLLGLLFYWKSIDAPFMDSIRILPIICILIYIMGYSMGMGSIPYTLIGDIFPSDVKSAASSITLLFLGGIFGLLTTSYPMAAEYFGTHTCMWFFAISSVLCILYIYFKLPETRGKTYLEIRKILEG